MLKSCRWSYLLFNTPFVLMVSGRVHSCYLISLCWEGYIDVHDDLSGLVLALGNRAVQIRELHFAFCSLGRVYVLSSVVSLSLT